MLKLIVPSTTKIIADNNLNTFNVKVDLILAYFSLDKSNLNTSHVKVNLYVLVISPPLILFKYIPC